jgi:hypothetical protein
VTEIPVRLIYKDPTRHFGGNLDDPSIRFKHYLNVLCGEVHRLQESGKLEVAEPSPCGCNE